MPAEHQLIAPSDAALFGKHPGHGDFISAGMPDDFERVLSEWLGATLGEVRDALGNQWEAVQSGSVALRFWIGGALADGRPWRGALRLSGDKVGRRYPLMAMQATTPDTLPTVAVDQAFYQTAESALSAMLGEASLNPAEALRGVAELFARHPNGTEATSDHMFWAAKQAANVEQLCAEVALTDLVAAASGRSYWWFENRFADQSGILACYGLPGAQALGWLIGGGMNTDTAETRGTDI